MHLSLRTRLSGCVSLMPIQGVKTATSLQSQHNHWELITMSPSGKAWNHILLASDVD